MRYFSLFMCLQYKIIISVVAFGVAAAPNALTRTNVRDSAIHTPVGTYPSVVPLYVGKTLRALRTRISEHRNNVRTGDERNPVAAHFKQAGHNVSALRYVGVEKWREKPHRGGDLEKRLLKRETFWIYFLNTMSYNGLNEEFDIKPFL